MYIYHREWFFVFFFTVVWITIVETCLSMNCPKTSHMTWWECKASRNWMRIRIDYKIHFKFLHHWPNYLRIFFLLFVWFAFWNPLIRLSIHFGCQHFLIYEFCVCLCVYKNEFYFNVCKYCVFFVQLHLWWALVTKVSRAGGMGCYVECVFFLAIRTEAWKGLGIACNGNCTIGTFIPLWSIIAFACVQELFPIFHHIKPFIACLVFWYKQRRKKMQRKTNTACVLTHIATCMCVSV